MSVPQDPYGQGDPAEAPNPYGHREPPPGQPPGAPPAWQGGSPDAGYPTGSGSAHPPSYPGGGGYPPPPQTGGGSGLAIAALVSGVLALLTFWTLIGGIVLGLAAIVMGFIARRKAKAGRAGGRGMALGGIVTGVLGLVLAIGMFALVGSLLYSNGGQGLLNRVESFGQCMEEAGDDRAAQERCQQQVERPTGPTVTQAP